MTRGALLAVAAAVAGCSAPATLGDLQRAERRERAGDTAGALAAYRDAQVSCRGLRPARRAAMACSEALLGEADLLARTGDDPAPAIAAYLAIPARAPDAATAAIAVFRASELQLRAGDADAGVRGLWQVVRDWPDEAPAADALRLAVDARRAGDPRALAGELRQLLAARPRSGVADNLVWALAELSERELADLAAARALYDRLPIDHPHSGLRDDARWHAARVSRALGDPAGAAARLRGLLATREVAFGAGSYFSIWLDDAQLELGRVLRDELRDPAAAIRAFRDLPRLYPASILRDDALFELAVTLRATGDGPGACAAVARLAREAPDSKYRGRAAAVCQ